MKRTIRWVKKVEWQVFPGEDVVPATGPVVIQGATNETVEKDEEMTVYVLNSNPLILSKPGLGRFPEWIQEGNHFEFLD